MPPISFLDLPKEVRLIIYENLPIRTRHLPGPFDSKLICRTLPGISILATCTLINAEAQPILNPRLRSIIAMPPQLTAHFLDLDPEVPTYLSVDRALVNLMMASWDNARNYVGDPGNTARFEACAFADEAQRYLRFARQASLYLGSVCGGFCHLRKDCKRPHKEAWTFFRVAILTPKGRSAGPMMGSTNKWAMRLWRFIRGMTEAYTGYFPRRWYEIAVGARVEVRFVDPGERAGVRNREPVTAKFLEEVVGEMWWRRKVGGRAVVMGSTMGRGEWDREWAEGEFWEDEEGQDVQAP